MHRFHEQLGDKYEMLEKVRVGGMGTIYKVRHRLLDEIRVVKVVHPLGTQGASADRFLREARAIIKLHHPNVAVLHDFAVGPDGQAYIVMEYIAGWNLQEILRAYGSLPVPLAIEIARQSLKALGYLHRYKIVHRDISPDNLMLSRDEYGHPLVKLIDLGIAKPLEEGLDLTAAGVFLGKPRYGAPERFNGGQWDERSDLYSFGVVFYELLTNCCPIAGSDSASLMAGHLYASPRDFAETDPGARVPPELRQMVLKSLAKKPEDRIASADDFLWMLTMLQDRFPLTPATVEPFWKVFHAAVPVSCAETPNTSLATPLAIPAAMAKALAAGRLNLGAGEDAADWTAPDLPQLPATSVTVKPPPLTVSTVSAPVKPAKRPRDTWASRTLYPFPEREPEPPAAPGRTIWRPLTGVGLLLILACFWLDRYQESLASKPFRPAVPVAEVRMQRGKAEASMKRGDLIARGAPGVQEPEVKRLPVYSYPDAAKGSRQRVSLHVAVLVDETGQVIDARLPKAKPSGLGFEEAALEAARKAQFFPATRNGIPGKMWTELVLEFAE